MATSSNAGGNRARGKTDAGGARPCNWLGIGTEVLATRRDVEAMAFGTADLDRARCCGAGGARLLASNAAELLKQLQAERPPCFAVR